MVASSEDICRPNAEWLWYQSFNEGEGRKGIGAKGEAGDGGRC